jgi:hypothetical protein
MTPRLLETAWKHLTGAERRERARRRWIAVGRRQVLPFEDIPRIPGATAGTVFEFRRSWFDSYVDFERRAREEQRRIQHAGWLTGNALRAATAPDEIAAAQRRMSLLEDLERYVESQIWAAGDAVDAALEEGHGRRCTVEALRHQPRLPATVERHEDALPWVAADLRRAPYGWPAQMDAGGEDHGYHWRLENPTRRWQTSRWRLSWLCMGEPTYEVYAVELLDRPRPDGAHCGRLLVLGVVHDREILRDALEPLERHAMRERNSLVSAALAVRDAAAQERSRTDAAVPSVAPATTSDG